MERVRGARCFSEKGNLSYRPAAESSGDLSAHDDEGAACSLDCAIWKRRRGGELPRIRIALGSNRSPRRQHGSRSSPGEATTASSISFRTRTDARHTCRARSPRTLERKPDPSLTSRRESKNSPSSPTSCLPAGPDKRWRKAYSLPSNLTKGTSRKLSSSSVMRRALSWRRRRR